MYPSTVGLRVIKKKKVEGWGVGVLRVWGVFLQDGDSYSEEEPGSRHVETTRKNPLTTLEVSRLHLRAMKPPTSNPQARRHAHTYFSSSLLLSSLELSDTQVYDP